MIGYPAQVIAAGQLYILFLIYAAACWAIVRPTLSAPHWLPTYVVGSLILGPVTLGLFLTLLFWVVPGRTANFYITTLSLAPFLVCLARFRVLANDVAAFQRAWSARTAVPSAAFWGLLLFAFPAFCLSFQLLILPLHGNDPLEYMQLGRLLYEQREAQIYPLRTALPSGGFIAPWTHPPTYGSLIALAFMLQGSSLIAGAAKLISLWFALASALFAMALVFAADRRVSWRLWLTPFVMLSLPIYFELQQTAHIDSIRIASFVTAIALAAHAVASHSRGAAAVAAYALGCATMTHSIGILAPMISLPMLIVCWRGSPKRLAEITLIIVAITLAIALPHYLRNVLIFGNPIQDSVPVWDLPALGVPEFLRGERGLETFSDRFVLGVLMPFTRIDLFGYLPTLGGIVALLLLAQTLRRRGLRGTTTAIFQARADHAALPVLIALLGFMALIMLSVLAGTDLAVKNVRYILTVIPIIVALTMIGIGGLVADEKVDYAVRRATAWLGRLVPGRRRVQALPKPAGSVSGAALACVVAAALILAQSADVFRLSYSNLRVYLGDDDIVSRRLFEAEPAKRNASILDDASIERIARDAMGPDDTALVFRQASYGFYHSRRFRFHVDTALTDLFQIEDPRALREALIKRGLTWIYTPGYPLPEINNSAFAALLRDPQLVRPVARSNGWGLYQVRAVDAAVTRTAVAAAMPMVRPGTQLYGLTDQGPGLVDGVRAKLTLDPQTGVAEFTRFRGAVKELKRWDAILSRPVSTRNDPNAVNAADFMLTDETRILLEAQLSGSGLAEMIVEYVSYPPVVKKLKDLQAKDDEIGGPRILRETIWSGLLSEKPETVGGWLMPSLSRIGSQDQRSRRGARIIFRLRDGNVLRVHGWKADAVSFGADPADSAIVMASDAINRGWVLSEASLNQRLGLQLMAGAAPAVRDDVWPFGPIGIKPVSDKTTLIAPPPFRPVAEAAAQGTAIDETFGAGALRLAIKATISGYGKVTPHLLIKCRLEPVRNFTVLTIIPVEQKDTIQTLQLQPLQLWEGEVEKMSWVVTPTCVPRSIRIVFASERQRALAIERSAADIGEQDYGSVDIYRVEMAMISDASGLNVPLRPFAETGEPAR
jgi:hypothetical protein